MKKNIVIIILFLSLISFIFAQTEVSGHITFDTTWNSEDSPYIVVGNVIVDDGVTLSILQNVCVFFNESTKLIIKGHIQANGDINNTIIFTTSNQNLKWDGIKFENTTSSNMNYCDIENSKDTGISILNSSLLNIRYCLIQNNSSDNSAGIDIQDSSDLLIEYSEIKFNKYNRYLINNEYEIIGGGGIALTNCDKINIQFNNINDNNRKLMGSGIDVEVSSNVHIYKNNIFNNNCVSGSGGGIYVNSGENNFIEQNVIYRNTTFEGGGGVFLKTACNLVDNNIYENNAGDGGGIFIIDWSTDRYFKNNFIHSNHSIHEGGGVFLHCSGPYPTIDNCKIYSNVSDSLNAGGMLIVHGSPKINYCEIYDNSAINGNGGGIYIRSGSPQINRTLIGDNHSVVGGGIYLYNTVPYPPQPITKIEQSTITSNSASSYCGGLYVDADSDEDVSNVDCYNSIFYNNTGCSEMGQEIYIASIENGYFSKLMYNCIKPNGLYIQNSELVQTENNVFANPNFTNPDNHDYYLLPDSPCIDSGCPTFPYDPDGTISDIGMIPFIHGVDTKTFNSGWNWVSFPRLTNQGYENGHLYMQVYYEDELPGLFQLTPNGFPTIEGFEEIKGKRNGEIFINPINNNFIDYDLGFGNKLFRYEGYKIEVSLGVDPTILEIDGDSLTSYTLNMSDDETYWLGYYLPYSQNIQDAFGDKWQYVNRVWAQDWYYGRLNQERGIGSSAVPANSTVGKTMEYGKMYIVQMHENVDNFSWNNSNNREDPIKKETPTSFSYTEKADYEAIDIMNIPADVTEIGVFENNKCVGAVCVNDTCAQILVYSDNANRESLPFSFEYVSGRSNPKSTENYLVLNKYTGKFESSVIFSGKQKYSVVKFDTKTYHQNAIELPKLYKNYPNPFSLTNSERGFGTTISFSLPKKENVYLTIYNIKGQKVVSLYSGIAKKGKHNIIWKGNNSNHRLVSSGIYFYKLKTDTNKITRKMLILK